MKEVKNPKKPLIYYYALVLLALSLFNLVVTPFLSRPQIDEVDYGTFMDMIEEKDVGVVEVTDTEITFTDKDNTKVYQTGAMYDPTLTERLHEAGAAFGSEDTRRRIERQFGISLKRIPLSVDAFSVDHRVKDWLAGILK